MRILIISCVTLLFVLGCDQCVPLEKVSGQKNTFQLKDALVHIESISVFPVYDENDSLPNAVWSIKNKTLISERQFHITVPEIPDGFVQVIPVPPQQFKLHTGKLYRIIVWYSGGSTCPGDLEWVAE